MRRLRLFSSMWCVAGLLSAVDANAATVTIRPHPEPVYGAEIAFLADPGERNRVVLREEQGRFSNPFDSAGVWVVRDSGAVLTARGPSCAVIDEHAVRCRSSSFGTPIGGYRLALGDRDDTLVVGATASAPGEQMWVVANGGPGDDELSGGETEYVLGDRLRGGGGDDELHGQGGPDILIDGDRSRATGDGGPGPDLLDGGDGEDTASYQGRSRPVSVDLSDAAPDGEAGEGDVLMGIESVTGGRADDRLAGDSGDNVLDGHHGRDQLAGHAGDDVFMRGGRSISCGAGNDRISPPRRSARITEREFLQPDCETFETGGRLRLDAYPGMVGPRSLIYRMRCPSQFSDDEEVGAFCAGKLTLREGSSRRRMLASASFEIERVGRVRARLSPTGRVLSSRRRGVRASLEIASPHLDPSPLAPDVVRWGIRLRRTTAQ